jgi:hypothetical protein
MIPTPERWSGDHGLTKDTTKAQAVADILLFDDGFDALEDCRCSHLAAFVR